MRAIVVGAGEVGYHVAERLANEKHDVVVVEIGVLHLVGIAHPRDLDPMGR